MDLFNGLVCIWILSRRLFIVAQSQHGVDSWHLQWAHLTLGWFVRRRIDDFPVCLIDWVLRSVSWIRLRVFTVRILLILSISCLTVDLSDHKIDLLLRWYFGFCAVAQGLCLFHHRRSSLLIDGPGVDASTWEPDRLLLIDFVHDVVLLFLYIGQSFLDLAAQNISVFQIVLTPWSWFTCGFPLFRLA